MTIPVGASVTHAIHAPESLAEEVGAAFVALAERLIATAHEQDPTLNDPYVVLDTMRYTTRFEVKDGTVKVILSGTGDVKPYPEEVSA